MRRLKKWVKVILTIIIVGISATMYIKTGRLGELAQSPPPNTLGFVSSIFRPGFSAVCISALA